MIRKLNEILTGNQLTTSFLFSNRSIYITCWPPPLKSSCQRLCNKIAFILSRSYIQIVAVSRAALINIAIPASKKQLDYKTAYLD
jgi:hypothetical protein